MIDHALVDGFKNLFKLMNDSRLQAFKDYLATRDPNPETVGAMIQTFEHLNVMLEEDMEAFAIRWVEIKDLKDKTTEIKKRDEFVRIMHANFGEQK